MRSPRPSSPSTIDEVDLLRRARAARLRAYAPYSGFRVGAVVLTEDGEMFEGVNVENASYRLTTCAEQAAIASMVVAGARCAIRAVAVVGDGDDPCMPCGGCRQAIHEFGSTATILASGDGGRPVVTSLGELLPHSFGAPRLAQGRQAQPW